MTIHRSTLTKSRQKRLTIAEQQKLRNLAEQMSNVLYNLKQQAWCTDHYRESAEKLVKEWDAAK